MFSLGSSHQYFLYTGIADMRKGFDALCGLVSEQLRRNPLSGEVFIFINRRRDHIKLLHWEYSGFVMYYKRLERGTIELPDVQQTHGKISWTTLVLMVEGIEMTNLKMRKRYEIKSIKKDI
jgi:transposase